MCMAKPTRPWYRGKDFVRKKSLMQKKPGFGPMSRRNKSFPISLLHRPWPGFLLRLAESHCGNAELFNDVRTQSYKKERDSKEKS